MTKARDISKLSAVEVDATADQTNTEVKAAVEAASDSNTFTDADHSKLNAIEASADVTDTANVTSSGALMDSELTNLAAVKAINQSLVTTASPTFGTVTATSADIGVSGSNANNYQLRVLAGTTGLSRFIAGDGSDAGYLDYNHNGDKWSIKTSGGERLEINSSGIDVTGTVTADGMTSTTGSSMTQLTVNGTGAVESGVNFANGGTTYGQIYFNNASPYDMSMMQQYSTGSLIFGTNDTERMRIDSSGNVLVGCTNPASSADTGIKLKENVTTNDAILSVVSSRTTSASEGLSMYSTGAAAWRFYVGWDGTVHATATSIVATSDERLKENIVDLETGLEQILALKPRRFDWKNGDATKVAGFIAQEVEPILPDLVVNQKHEELEDLKGLKMGDILPTLVKALQEQQVIIESLTARITILEA